MDIRKLQRAIVDGLEDVKAQAIVVFNTEHLSPLFERVIVASGTSNRQTKALAASVRDAVKAGGMPVLRTEGEDNGEWIIVDCGAAVAHIMQPAIRDYYRLEEIWGGKPVKLKIASDKTTLPKASESADEADEVPVKKKPAAKKATAAHAAPTEKSAAGRAALGKSAPKRRTAGDGAATAKKPAAARKVSSGHASGAGAAAKKAAPARKAAAPVKKAAAAKTVATKKAAPAKKAPARKSPAAKAAPARKSAAR
ncbi:ribosome silencing factor [Ideonella sp.]|uniref:ribosome silencing factor n=1 Tax=Ideonella sp. TaxID=1929293 RepID=UPI002B486030|nr:ribosome silencing factor [Ideonella sp.]HJV68584.1 ribosome silencing factor [Ideonella sp.]